MKAYLLIMAILFIYIKSDCSATSGIDRYTDCTNRVLSLVEKGFGNSYCCYIYGVNGNEKKKDVHLFHKMNMIIWKKQ